MPGITLPVPALVVRQNSCRKLRIESAERPQHLRPFCGVLLDRAAFIRRQDLRFSHNVRDRAVDLSNIVKQRDPLDASLASLIEIGGSGKSQGVFGNAPHVSSRFRVVGVDRVEKGLQACRPESLERYALATLLIVESACDPAGEKREVREHVPA